MAISLPRQRFSARLSRFRRIGCGAMVFTVTRPARAHPTVRSASLDVFRRRPDLAVFSRFRRICCGAMVFTVTRPARAHPTVRSASLDVFRRRPDLAVFSRFRRIGCGAMVFTVSRPARAHPTVRSVSLDVPTSARLSRFQPVPSFWLARHGFSPYLDRRAPTRL